jgi:outer membrane biosynthesis protein TonB
VTELAAPQISSLMEALPGIAAVLRSPVANAIVAICRSAAGLEEFQLAHAEELLRFGVRRNLLTPEEVDSVLDELRVVVSKRPPKPAPPVVKKAPVKPEGPKVPHRPKGIQLKPAAKHVPPPPPPKPKPLPVTKPVVAKKPAAKSHGPVKASSHGKPAAKKTVIKPKAHKPAGKKRR